MTFRIKRGYFYAVLVPLAFFLGLAAGYLTWGRGAEAPADTASLDLAEVSSLGNEAAGLVQPTEVQQSVAEQIEGLRRYEIEIDENDPVFGPDDAPITIIEFSDFECPFCQRHFAEVYPRLLAEYPGQIRFVYKDFPLTSIHPNARGAAMAAQCAFEQEAFWDFHDLLFSGRLELARTSYETYAGELSLDTAAFATCLDEERYADVVDADMELARSLGISSTPTFFVNGIGIVGARPFDVFAQVIDYELSQAEAEGN